MFTFSALRSIERMSNYVNGDSVKQFSVMIMASKMINRRNFLLGYVVFIDGCLFCVEVQTLQFLLGRVHTLRTN